jgi:hydrogenase nickel insertion protein HypA
MHEYSIIAALLERVNAEARAKDASRVHRLTVRIGELAGVDVQLLETAYTTFRERTICDSAELVIQQVAAEWRCPHCSTLIARGKALRCLTCDMPAQLVAGDEIFLDRIEMETNHV